MKILLISSPARTYAPNVNMPIGIMWLAAWLEQHGYEVSIIDGALLRETPDSIADRAMAEHADLIGISGIITSYAFIIGLTRALKQRLPNTPIVLGAQVVINNMSNCFQHMPIEYAISGYGEIPLLKLVRHLEGEEDRDRIPGLTYRDGDTIVTVPGREYVKDINELPLPAYHLIDMEYYANILGRSEVLENYQRKTGHGPKKWRWGQIMGTLGCTDRCTFCVHEQEFVGLKRFSTDYMRKHIKFLTETYDIDILKIGEEMFVTTLKNIKPFNEMMMNEFPDVYWSANTRANHITPDIVEELQRGNCFQVAWGFELGSQRMLDLMQKRIKRQQNIDAYKYIDASSMGCSMTFMVGNVGETDATIKETVAAIREAQIPTGGAFYAQPYPGGRTWDWAIEKKIIPDSHAYLMAASDQDATVLSINMTPYPFWVLKAWNRQIVAACQRNALPRLRRDLKLCRSRDERQALIRKTIMATLRGWLPHKVPFFIHHLATRIYCTLFDLRARYRPTARDMQYGFDVDDKKAICASQVLVARPQRYLDPEKLNAVLADGPHRAPLNGPENSFVDGVHARLLKSAAAEPAEL